MRMALEALGCSAKEAMYFGDSDVDMITGRNAGIETIGVSWGFRSFGELFAQHPAAIIDDPSHIPSLFENVGKALDNICRICYNSMR